MLKPQIRRKPLKICNGLQDYLQVLYKPFKIYNDLKTISKYHTYYKPLKIHNDL